jgi:hypothetical protein
MNSKKKTVRQRFKAQNSRLISFMQATYICYSVRSILNEQSYQHLRKIIRFS